jgi:hypothetical protein
MPDNQDPFYEIIGRALLDQRYRDRLLDPNTQVEAMVDGGLTQAQAVDVQSELQAAIEAMKELHDHEVFGDFRPFAA